MSFRKNVFFVTLSTLALTMAGCGGSTPPAPTIVSIAVKADSVPTEFVIGDPFSVDGGKLMVTWSDTRVDEVDMTLAMVTNAPSMNEEHLNYTVNVLYEEKTTSYVVNVRNAVISIDIKPGSISKTTYDVGDTFTVEGGQLYVSYADGTRPPVDMTLDMITNPPDMDTAVDSYKVYVSYGGKTTSFNISILYRVEVNIGVAYAYNYGELIDIEDFSKELVFTSGKDYSFNYGANPSEALDSISFAYFTRGDNPEQIANKPTENGEYSYKVYLPSGNAEYKPTEKVVNFKIQDAVVENFVMNNETELPLTDEAGEAEAVVCGVAVKFNNAKAATNGAATLVRGAGSRIEINNVDFNSGLTVEFEGDNNFVSIYGSYDATDWVLVDTLSAYKSATDRAKNYAHARICSYLIGNDEVVIKSVSFTYEENGLPAKNNAIAEASDLINTASSEEGNAYFKKNEQVLYNEDKSILSIGLRVLQESVNIQFDSTLKEEEIKRYQVELYVRPTDDATYESDTICPLYAKPTNGLKPVGDFKKIHLGVPTGSETNEWEKLTINLIEFFENGLEGDITGFNIWVNRNVATGLVLLDDIRLVQKESYPEAKELSYITLEGDIVTEFNKGDEFVFGGKVYAHYTDWEARDIALDNPNLTITAPNMNSSGTKTVTVSFTDLEKTRTATYKVEIVGGGKAEETMDIVDDSVDLANAAHQYHNGKSYDTGIVTDETENTYNDSQNAIKATIPEAEKNQPDSYFILKLDADITGDYVTLSFFAKNIGDYDIYVQLFSEDGSEKAYRDESQVGKTSPKGDASTVQGKANSFAATDAGNDWVHYSYTYYAKHMTKAIRLVRIATLSVMPNTHFFYMDGITASVAS